MINSYEYNKPLCSLHTMHFPVKADYYIQIKDKKELIEHLSEISEFEKIYYLGEGSNTIFLKDFSGLVVHLKTKGIQLISENKKEVKVEVEAGENWHDFVKTCIQNQWFGLENLTLIPGSVGAAPVQNIGAYGVEVKDFIELVQCIDINTGKLIELTNEECLFRYRNSIFKQQENKHLIITSVIFRLNKQFIPNLSYQELANFIQDDENITSITAELVSDCVRQLRQKKLPDPKVLGNSGSFFHNPILNQNDWQILKNRFKDIPSYKLEDYHYKVAAGWMIDQLGLKGFRVGDMGVHDWQALVLVNHGKGMPNELLKLIAIIKDAVCNQFNIALTVEPNLV
ncbi:UDP-N-acetylmuramate dehydrogenase [Neisseriaceae bacterium PsAf]|nr:UDP-N-acetylmuramate dehydrogenase [Neisseriaceae bacterium PsAf]